MVTFNIDRLPPYGKIVILADMMRVSDNYCEKVEKEVSQKLFFYVHFDFLDHQNYRYLCLFFFSFCIFYIYISIYFCRYFIKNTFLYEDKFQIN